MNNPVIIGQVDSKKLNELASQTFQEGEIALGMFTGKRGIGQTGGWKKHYLVITDRRVIMWQRGFASGNIETFMFENISNIEANKGFVAGHIIINSAGAREKFAEMNKSTVNIAADLIRTNMVKAKKQPISQTIVMESEDPITIIKQRFAKGEITAEEYQSSLKILGGDSNDSQIELSKKTCGSCNSVIETSGTKFCTHCGSSI